MTNSNKDNNNENSDFFSEFSDVKPLQQDKVTITKKNQDKINIPYRKKVAQSFASKQKNFLTDNEVEPVKPEDVLSYKLDGVQPNVFKKLRLGKYEYQYHLDLHRRTVAEAREDVYQLIIKANQANYRCLLITHGKGIHSNPPARIKSFLYYWLKQIDDVLAFHSAIAKHGGTGSVYVLLRKTLPEKNTF